MTTRRAFLTDSVKHDGVLSVQLPSEAEAAPPMNVRIRKAILPVILFCCAGSSLLAQSQTNAAQKKLTSSVSGRVTVNGKGRSGIVVGVHIKAFDPTHSPARKAETDADGVYRIKDVPPGDYYVAPMSTSLVFADSSLMSFQGKALILSEGETIEGIDFAMVRGAVITGKVTDEDGDPVIEQQVSAIPADQPNQSRFTHTPIAFQTDDRGVYRIFGLRAGRYKVAVGNSDFDGRDTNSRYSRIYYSDVSAANADKAKIIELAEGDQASNIDITVTSRLPGFAVSGKILNAETNQPLANARIMPQRMVGDRDSYVPISGVSNQKGEFRLDNLQPGTYSLLLAPTSETNLRADSVRFQIIDQDVSGLVVRAVRGATVAGTVMIEGNIDAAVLAKLLQRMRVHAWVRGEGISGNSVQPSPIAADGSFRLTSLAAGVAHFQLMSTDYRRPGQFVISRVEREGVVIPRDGLEIKSGEELSGVKLIVSYGSGSVRGTINFEKVALSPGLRVFVRLTKTGEAANAPLGGEVDARGKFLIENVAPGTYDLVVSTYSPGSPSRPPVLAKRSVIVTQDAVTEVIISIEPPDNP